MEASLPRASGPQTDLTLDELVPVVIGERPVEERRRQMKDRRFENSKIRKYV